MEKQIRVTVRRGFLWTSASVAVLLTLGPLALVFRAIAYGSGCATDLLVEAISRVLFKTIKK